MPATQDAVERNRALQTEWYGEPLGDRFRRVLDRMGLSQSGLAGVLGLSAPMLSQLMSGQRAKISNPAVLHRLLAVEELAAEADTVPPGELRARLDEIREESPTTTSTLRAEGQGRATSSGRGGGVMDVAWHEAAPPESPARVLQALLREVASAAEIEAAAATIDVNFPEIAEVLRVYGNGRAADAEAHLKRTLQR
ncbi:helix-turn-helix domain-containing protein [Actinomadura rupiterrae]|uniref:helix-turn-helix domain-containing protein n=1 Tax=Actinomadura rupiterrae TaxID=559627 RepID=UPI0020A42CB9|nr:helix-turn-helix domain-containing protein [Actinomadura rupiterrae]MCP2336646.1 transcriptional regulator with XRE-family HTH domain [Actinomadura rupiterrae]